ncbi:hypothetical protein Tco_0922633 [Tanacetum coccineum]|uniref:Uncharacterized protein n=1 Tax=Tanacetum coccineum TaxID=301880 RepID=A0ABQ5D5X2_9ASTR
MVGPSSSEDLISSLDLDNPLHLQNSDFRANTIIFVKLTGTENYRSAYANSAPQSNQWERCNFIMLSWLLNSVSEDIFLGQIFADNAVEVWAELKETYDKLDREDVLKHNQLMKLMQFLMGLSDVFQPNRSSLLSRETLPDVKDAFAIVSREESHRGIVSSSSFGSVSKP